MAPCFCRRCNRSWLLWRKCKLHFSHCEGKRSNIILGHCIVIYCSILNVTQNKYLCYYYEQVACVDLHGRAFLLCVCAGDSSMSAGDGSVFHRSRMDMASHPCGSTRGHGDEQPDMWTKIHIYIIYIYIFKIAWILNFERVKSFSDTYHYILYKCFTVIVGISDIPSYNYSWQLCISAISPYIIERENVLNEVIFRFVCEGVITCTKRAPHVSHLYGFSPEWMRVWVLRLAGLLNWAPQILQR